MARRNRFAGNAFRNNFAPPPPVAVAAPVIDLPALRTAYAWMSINKMAGFKLVLEWYANNQAALLYKDPLDAAESKEFDRIDKLIKLGNGSPYEAEQVNSWSLAIKKMEKLWSHKAPAGQDWPTLDKASHLSQVPELVQNVQTVLGNLNAAFANAGVTFRVTFESGRQFLHGEILLPQAEAVAMITQSPLQVALNEVPTVAKVLAIVMDGNGGQQLDGGLFMQKLPVILTQVGVWAAANDKLNKPVGKAPRAAKVAGAAGAPRQRAANPNALKLNPTDVITILGANRAFKGGKRGAVWGMLRNGMTVGQLKQEAEAKIKAGGYAVQVLKVMVTQGLVKVN